MGNKKYGIIGLAVVVLLLVIIGAVVNRKGMQPIGGKNPPPTSISPVGPGNSLQLPVVVSLNAASLAQVLPKNFPTEAKSQTLQNSKVTDPTTQTVTILRTTTTVKSLADALKTYKDYVGKNGWTITNTTDVATLKVLSATKSTAKLTITISYDGASKSNVVVVNYVTPV